ncbi:MAG: hypothetical protein KGN39_00385 [Betaproteobacteria bacterium]|nr:hypothetical protein [Betaproteobacteria bacterium]
MDLHGLTKALELRFSCSCQVLARELSSYKGRTLMSITYDTPWLPHTWEEFVRYDDQTRANMMEFLRLELGVSDSIEITIDHVARVLHLRWVPVGIAGAMQVPEAPLYFERTGQLDQYRTDLHIFGRDLSDF